MTNPKGFNFASAAIKVHSTTTTVEEYQNMVVGVRLNVQGNLDLAKNRRNSLLHNFRTLEGPAKLTAAQNALNEAVLDMSLYTSNMPAYLGTVSMLQENLTKVQEEVAKGPDTKKIDEEIAGYEAMLELYTVTDEEWAKVNDAIKASAEKSEKA